MRKRLLVGAAMALLTIFGACRFLLPERFAVNAPIANSLFGSVRGAPADDEFARMRGPAGWSVSIFAEVPRPRMLEVTNGGHLLVSAPREDKIWVLAPDRDGDGSSDGMHALDLEIDRPHGLDLHDGWLYIGEGARVSRVRFDEASARARGELVEVASLPDGGNHWTKTVGVGPDGKLYVTVGSTCNVCVEDDERRASMLRFELDGSGYELYATGLRNAVGFDWQPRTGALYATDNGRDLLGDDFPPCELNRVERGGFYGWPVANGSKVPDPDLGSGEEARIARSIAPAFDFAAHNAPLGIEFAAGPHAPREYIGAALVALHGSWNRTRKDGYKVVSLHWRKNGTIEERDFLVGFEQDDDVIGRPADVALGTDGAFYVTDDYAGLIWRVARGEAASSGTDRKRRAGPVGTLDALSPEERLQRAQRGAALYEQHACASCHDRDHAAPGVVAVPLLELEERYTLDSLQRFFEAPAPPMPLFPLSDEERRDLAVHLLEAE